MAKPIYKYIPNLLTLSNGLFGALSIVMYLTVSLEAALGCIAVSLIADVLDGMTARLLHATSDIGGDLDSLSDVISFGAAPAILLTLVLRGLGWGVACWAPLLVVPASIYRLAKFNNDPRQTTSFIGLATTGNAVMLAPLALFFESHAVAPTPLYQTLFVLFMIVDAWLLVCEVPFFGLKQLSKGWRANIGLIIVVIAAIVALILFGIEGIAWAMMLYILLNLITWLTHKSGAKSTIQ